MTDEAFQTLARTMLTHVAQESGLAPAFLATGRHRIRLSTAASSHAQLVSTFDHGGDRYRVVVLPTGVVISRGGMSRMFVRKDEDIEDRGLLLQATYFLWCCLKGCLESERAS
jgi:hypothetical protein